MAVMQAAAEKDVENNFALVVVPKKVMFEIGALIE